MTAISSTSNNLSTALGPCSEVRSRWGSHHPQLAALAALAGAALAAGRGLQAAELAEGLQEIFQGQGEARLVMTTV